MVVKNIESVPSEAGPDLDGIGQGISNYEVEIATSRASHAPRNDSGPIDSSTALGMTRACRS